MRSKRNPEVKADWDEYDKADRYLIQKQMELEKTGQVGSIKISRDFF